MSKAMLRLAFRAGYHHGAFDAAGIKADDKQVDAEFEKWFDIYIEGSLSLLHGGTDA